MFKVLPTDRISDVQGRFQSLFPLLQLRFYREAHGLRAESDIRDEIKDPNQLLRTLNPGFMGGEIALASETTVGQFETEFASRFGLHIQVYRKAGNDWIQTTSTDLWPLSRQQEAAEETDHFFKNIRR